MLVGARVKVRYHGLLYNPLLLKYTQFMVESHIWFCASCAMAAVILVSNVSLLSSGMLKRCVTESYLTPRHKVLAMGSISRPPFFDRVLTSNACPWIVRRELCRFGATGAGKESDLIVTQDWNGPNSGVILIKNSDFSRWLLQEWWDQKQFVNGPYPFHYEQVCLYACVFLLGFGWRRGVGQSDGVMR